MEKNIAVIWGDCSSPEIVKQDVYKRQAVQPATPSTVMKKRFL